MQDDRRPLRKAIILSAIIVAGLMLGLGIASASHWIRITVAAWLAPRSVARYIASHPVRKLQLGAGDVELPGWLNTDIEPLGRETYYLDATQRFPMPDRSINYIFAEHVVEH